MKENGMDGSFEIEVETIYYRITDDTKPVRMVGGVEIMSRYISFYKESGEHIGTTSMHGFDIATKAPTTLGAWNSGLCL